MSDWELVVPEATVNLVTNPSFETNVTGWAANVIAAPASWAISSEQSKYGAFSGKMVFDAGDLVAGKLTLVPVTINVDYAFSVWINLTAIAAGSVKLDIRHPGASETDIFALSAVSDGWVKYTGTLTADATGNAQIRLFTDDTADATIYIDAVQFEQKSGYQTTYCDGDQPGCEWNGTAHGSTSQRSAQSRAGGRVRDFKDDFGFGVSNFMNTGMPVQSTEIDLFALLPGGQLNDIKIEPREFTLMGTLDASKKSTPCVLSLDELRADLEEELAHDRYPEGPDGWQPLLIRYTGADVDKEIACHYSGGLEGRIDIDNVIHEKMGIRFSAPDPLWYEIGQSSQVLDTEDAPTLRYAAGRLRSTGQWDDLGLAANPTTGGRIFATAVGPDGKVYYGGTFTGWGGVGGRDYIARYNLVTDAWETVGGAAAVGNSVFALEFGPDGTLYAGGTFVNLGDADGDRIAQYDIATDTWSSLAAAASNGSVLALKFGLDGTLYLGGSFINWDGDGAQDYITSWTGAAYAALATGADNDVDDIATHPLTGDIAIVGNFANVSGVAADGIAIWDISATAWTSPSSGLAGGGGTGNTVDYNESGTLFFGGSYTSVDGVAATYISKYNGTSWSPLGAGMDDQVLTVRLAPDGTLYAAGVFTRAGDVAIADRIARWNGSSWAHLDLDLPGAPNVDGLAFGLPDPVVEQNYDIWLGFDTTGAAAIAGSATVTNDGTAHTFPDFIIERSVGTSAILETLRNETLGLELLYDYSLLDGETLTTFNHPLVQNIVSSFFQQRLDATLAGDDFGDWSLQPDDNQVTCFVDNDGATIVGYLLWRDAYKGHSD